MLTTEEIKSLCDAAGLDIIPSCGDTEGVWYCHIYDLSQHQAKHICGVIGNTEDNAIQLVWEAYVNNRKY